jgi:preprotein translocase subunit SecD
MNTRRNLWISLILTVVASFGAVLAAQLSNTTPTLGLDLQGGFSVVLQAREVNGELPSEESVEKAKDIIRQRVDGLGIAEPEVQRQGNTVVVDLPGVKEREKAEEQVGQTAELRFRLVEGTLPWDAPVPSSTTTVPGQTTVPGATPTTPGASTTAPANGSTATTITGSGAGPREQAVPTVPIAATRPVQETTTTPPAAPTTTAPTTAATPQPGQSCRDLVATREQNLAASEVWLPGRPVSGSRDPDVCYLLGPAILTGRNISSASSQYDTNLGSYAADVTFKTDEFVEKVAQPYVGRQVAIELDGVVQSAPTINEGITGRRVQISGDFSKGEASDLAQLLKYGALPVQFDRDEQTVQSISPTLGNDQLRAGIVAGIIGLVLVATYMLLYYRLLGLVVIAGLVLTGMLFFTLTSYLSANRGLALTLAGVTGLIVSVGVTVDSYVVYFERLKDEIRSGKTVRSSLDSGFRRSFRTIIAADLVSLLGAAILYWLAAGSVRGFAFFLGISTAIDLVLAYTFMHPFVVLLARRPNLLRAPRVGIAAGLDVPELRA